MYRQFLQVMFLDIDGWHTLRDDEGCKIEFNSLGCARLALHAIANQQGVLDVMTVRVEQSQVFDMVKRMPMIHTIYTGLSL